MYSYTENQVVGSNGVKFIMDLPTVRKSNGKTKRQALFECPLCHDTFVAEPNMVRSGQIKKCPNHKHYQHYKGGQVVGDNGIRFIRYTDDDEKMGEFLCECGNRFITRFDNVKYNRRKSCGCEFGKNVTTDQKLNNLYKNMVDRCTKEWHNLYKYYGARGITVYKGWLDDKQEFFDYIKTVRGWDDPNLSMDRINNNDGYYPGNLHFITQSEQLRNRRTWKKQYKPGDVLGNGFVFVEEVEPTEYSSSCKMRRVVTRCPHCGEASERFLSSITNDRVKSCGCLKNNSNGN